MKKITIGIPAYNEEANIQLLLNDVLSQHHIGKYVEKIIVVSDGSTDATVQKVKELKSTRISIVIQRKRRGLAKTLQHICSLAETDVLVVINADAHIQDPLFIKKLTAPIINGKADLTSTKLTEVAYRNYFERILMTGFIMKSRIVQSWKRGQNVLTCYGVARAFSKDLYTTIDFPTSIGEDAYSYFYTITHGFRYAFVRNTEIFYKPSSNYREHRLQTLRFFRSQEIMKKIFGEQFVKEQYAIPQGLAIKELLRSFGDNPLVTMLYMGTVLVSKIVSLFTPLENTHYWEVAKSSKEAHVSI
jgi:glycosyltransferase involved in cell wall biosynthesis